MALIDACAFCLATRNALSWYQDAASISRHDSGLDLSKLSKQQSAANLARPLIWLAEADAATKTGDTNSLS